jgi:hypothetical protein
MNTEYYEIGKARITKSRNMVISKCSKGGFTLAQQLEVKEEGSNKTIPIFMKGAIHVEGVEGLENIRDELDRIIDEDDGKK